MPDLDLSAVFARLKARGTTRLTIDLGIPTVVCAYRGERPYLQPASDAVTALAGWVAWLRDRNAAATAPRRPAKPKKGTQLDMFGGGR